MRKAIIMSGVSGSGKSTHANYLLTSLITREQIGRIVSADSYFMVDGVYRFNPKELGVAHGKCLQLFIEGAQVGTELLMCDNTNTTNVELAPYIAVALAYGYQVEVITLMCASTVEVEKCAQRNSHGAPMNAVLGMHQRIQDRMQNIPFHWQPSMGVTFTQVPVTL